MAPGSYDTLRHRLDDESTPFARFTRITYCAGLLSRRQLRVEAVDELGLDARQQPTYPALRVEALGVVDFRNA